MNFLESEFTLANCYVGWQKPIRNSASVGCTVRIG